MGTRAQVRIVDTDVYLYQHYDGYDLYETVKDAIRKKWRWNDPPYLARIIFDEMTKDAHGDETGFGIMTKPQSDIEFLVEVDCMKQSIRNIELDGCGKRKKIHRAVSFHSIVDS